MSRADVRLRVLERDGWTCQYCGLWMSTTEATIDHILPRSFGGATFDTNLRACCERCNKDKADTSEHYLKALLAFERTPLSRIISLEQYHQLRGVGVALAALDLQPFEYELSIVQQTDP